MYTSLSKVLKFSNPFLLDPNKEYFIWLHTQDSKTWLVSNGYFEDIKNVCQNNSIVEKSLLLNCNLNKSVLNKIRIRQSYVPFKVCKLSLCTDLYLKKLSIEEIDNLNDIYYKYDAVVKQRQKIYQATLKDQELLRKLEKELKSVLKK